jgi:hypothetical protein
MVEPSKRKQKGRSPRYPGIDLETAIQRAGQLWEQEAQYSTNVHTVLHHWGYQPKSGAGAVAIAALKSFGLLEDSGSGDARTATLTHLAQDIVLADDEEKRTAAIQSAALLPTAHDDLWKRYSSQLPSDQSLQLYLIRERHFTPGGAKELAAEYKRTLAFAGLTGRGATVSQWDPEEIDLSGISQDATVKAPAARTVATGGMATVSSNLEIPVPLTDGGMVVISVPRRMTIDAWGQMLSVLEAYKPALTSSPDLPPND